MIGNNSKENHNNFKVTNQLKIQHKKYFNILGIGSNFNKAQIFMLNYGNHEIIKKILTRF